MSAIEVLLPKQCGHCGGNLLQKSGKVPTAGEPRRHHVTEVPPVTAQITEYQFPKSGLWALRIGDTGAAARGPKPCYTNRSVKSEMEIPVYFDWLAEGKFR